MTRIETSNAILVNPEENITAAKKLNAELQKRNPIVQFFIRLFSCSYNSKMKTLVSATADHYKGKLKDLVDRVNLAKDTLEKNFLERVIAVAIKNIEIRQENRGIIYEITNNKGNKSHIIGTIHSVNKNMTINPQITEIVKKSSTIVTEVGNDRIFLLAHKLKKLNPFNKLRYSLDSMITNLANKEKKAVIGLTTIAEASRVLNEAAILEKKSEEYEMTEANHARLIKHEKYLYYEAMEAWQNGDDKDLKVLRCELMHPARFDRVCTKVNDEWLNNRGLLELLQAENCNSCVAVGVSHLYGSKGLLNAFQTNGLTIQKLG